MKQEQITTRLSQTLDFITQYQKKNGASPSYREIMHGCGYNSLGLVAKDINRMIARGWIDSAEHYNGKEVRTPSGLKLGRTGNASIVGECACGEPMTAIENIEGTVALPVDIFGSEEHIILRAKGRSMINCGIFDGDLMVVDVQPEARVGQIVVARVEGVDGGCATAKIFAEKNGQYYLKPANDEVDLDGNRLYNDIPLNGKWDIVGVVSNVIHTPKLGCYGGD